MIERAEKESQRKRREKRQQARESVANSAANREAKLDGQKLVVRIQNTETQTQVEKACESLSSCVEVAQTSRTVVDTSRKSTRDVGLSCVGQFYCVPCNQLHGRMHCCSRCYRSLQDEIIEAEKTIRELRAELGRYKSMPSARPVQLVKPVQQKSVQRQVPSIRKRSAWRQVNYTVAADDELPELHSHILRHRKQEELKRQEREKQREKARDIRRGLVAESRSTVAPLHRPVVSSRVTKPPSTPDQQTPTKKMPDNMLVISPEPTSPPTAPLHEFANDESLGLEDKIEDSLPTVE